MEQARAPGKAGSTGPVRSARCCMSVRAGCLKGQPAGLPCAGLAPYTVPTTRTEAGTEVNLQIDTCMSSAYACCSVLATHIQLNRNCQLQCIDGVDYRACVIDNAHQTLLKLLMNEIINP